MPLPRERLAAARLCAEEIWPRYCDWAVEVKVDLVIKSCQTLPTIKVSVSKEKCGGGLLDVWDTKPFKRALLALSYSSLATESELPYQQIKMFQIDKKIIAISFLEKRFHTYFSFSASLLSQQEKITKLCI